MATATLSSTPTVIDNAEAITNWGGDTFSLEPDIKVQGSNSVACAQTATGNNDVYVSGSWNFSAGGAGDQHLRLWFNITYIGNLATSNQIQVFLSDGTNTAYYYWDKASSYSGGWAQVVIYTGDTPDSGSVNKASITQIGMRFVTTTKPRNVPANAWFDAWTYGDGYTVTGGTSGDPINWSHIAAADKTNGYGIVTNIDDVFFLKGAVQIGNGSSAVYFSPTGQLVQFTNEQVSSSLYKISFADSGSALSNVNISDGAWAAASGAPRYVIDASDTDINDFSLSGVQISSAGAISFHTGASVLNCVWNNCGRITPSGATFQGHTISNFVSSTEGALLWPTSGNTSKCDFINCDLGVEITQTANQVFSGMTFDDVSGNYDVFLNNGGNNIEVAKTGGSNPNSYTTNGGGTVTFTASVTLTISANVSLVGAEVRIYDLDGAGGTDYGTELAGTESHNAATYAYTGNSGNLVAIQVMLLGYVEFVQSITMPSSDQTLDIKLVLDVNS